MDIREIRKLFLEYFKMHGHTIMPSSSLVPVDDPSLLFTSAGMVQFKKVFLGQETLPYSRVVTCQRCLRAGGKHNDLENVGFTSRHHTFFEMLGNFSFGDYFKREAITYAWEFITKYLKIPPSKLWVTVYEDDQETADLWLKELKIDPKRFSKCDAAENFWAMGDLGPCGPCTEIYYDHGPELPGSPPGAGDPKERYIEIYNLVFMQYDRTASGELIPLPKPCVDTGMGLERVAAIMQGVQNNYHIDLFRNLILDLGKLLHTKELTNNSLQVIADHLRAGCFMVIDGILPSNEGRGYVLRRILRRAIRHGYKLGRRIPFLHLAVTSLVKVMGADFPELAAEQTRITEIFLAEETQFFRTLENGIELLNAEIKQLAGFADPTINGGLVFKLYDTYGFPVDLTLDLAREYKVAVDLNGFTEQMQIQKDRARQATKFKSLAGSQNLLPSTFLGYEQTQLQANIVQLFTADDQATTSLQAEEVGKVVLDLTPFYAESGGQVGDTGILLSEYGQFIVEDTKKLGPTNMHIGRLAHGKLTVGERVNAKIDLARRNRIKAHHSATHLLHAALKQLLGGHVKQKGSLVDDQRLRFDFEHFKALTSEQLFAVEAEINAKIRANCVTVVEEMSVADALAKGAVALFGEKYQEQVRVLDLAGGFSVELCGGTHVASTGEIGCFKIITEEAVAAGVRRIEAVAGEQVMLAWQAQQAVLDQLAKLFKLADHQLILSQVTKLIEQNKELTKNLTALEKHNILTDLKMLLPKVLTTPAGFKILVAKVQLDPKYLKFAIDQLKQQLNSAVIVLGCTYLNQANLIVGITQDLINNSKNNQPKVAFSAVTLIHLMSPYINGKGGGKPDLAEAKGTNGAGLDQALQIGSKNIQEGV